MQLPNSPHSPSGSKSDPAAAQRAGKGRERDNGSGAPRVGFAQRLKLGFQVALIALMGLFALGLMLAAVAVGAMLTLGVVVWSVLRGRKPSLDSFHTVYRRARSSKAAGPWRRDAGTAAPAKGEVVDIEVREIREP